MSYSIPEILQHIQTEIHFLEKTATHLTWESFVQDGVVTRAFVRSLEIIGEAVKKLPDSFRDTHQEIAWRSMAGMRDKLIHDYFGIDYELVWDVVKNKIPDLGKQISLLGFDSSR